MKRMFKITIDFEADISEEITEPKVKHKNYLKRLIKGFLRNPMALLEFFKWQIPKDLWHIGRHLEKIEELFDVSDIHHSMRMVLEKCPTRVKKYYTKIVELDEREKLPDEKEDLDHLVFQLGNLTVAGATLEEIVR